MTISPFASRSLTDRWTWLRLALALTIVIAAWVVTGPVLRIILSAEGRAVLVLHEHFNNGAISGGKKFEASGAFERCLDGYCLPPGGSGTIVYSFVAQHEVMFLNLWLRMPSQGSNKLSVSMDQGATWRVLVENGVKIGGDVDLGGRAVPGQEVWLKFEGRNDTPNQALIVDEMKVLYRTGHATRLPSSRYVFGMVIAFGMAGVVLCRRWGLALSTVVILAAAAALRYDLAVPLLTNALDPDALAYRQFALKFQPFTENGFYSGRFGYREPFFIFVAWLYDRLIGNTDFGLRMLTVALSTASVWAMMRLGRALFGAIAGQAIGVAAALSAVLIVEAVRGMRLELEIILCMAYFGLAFVKTWRSDGNRLEWFGVLPQAVVLSILGGLMVLTRSTYLPIVLALNAWSFYGPELQPTLARVKQVAVGLLVTVAIVVAMAAPHRYGLYKTTGDPFYDTNSYARWNANVEFAGKPGFPTELEMQANPFGGPRITYGEYMFGLHTPKELAEGTLRGYWKLFRRMEVCPGGPFNLGGRCEGLNAGFQYLALAGLVVALWMPRYRWIPLAFAVLEFPVSFLYDRGLVEVYRHSYTAFPLILFAAMVTLVTLAQAVAHRLGAPSMARAAGA